MIVGSIGYDVHSGLGHLLKGFYDHHLIQKVLIIPHPRYERHPEWYTTAFNRRTQAEFLRGLSTLLIFENAWYWDVVRAAKMKGIKIVVVPMYEWSPNPWPVPPDLIVCPSDGAYS